MIVNANINKIIIGFVVIAVVFTNIFMLNPEYLGIQPNAASPKYVEKLFPEAEKL